MLNREKLCKNTNILTSEVCSALKFTVKRYRPAMRISNSRVWCWPFFFFTLLEIETVEEKILRNDWLVYHIITQGSYSELCNFPVMWLSSLRKVEVCSLLLEPGQCASPQLWNVQVSLKSLVCQVWYFVWSIRQSKYMTLYTPSGSLWTHQNKVKKLSFIYIRCRELLNHFGTVDTFLS